MGGTLELLDLLRSDRLDVVLGMGPFDDAAALRTAPMQWLGDGELIRSRVLPLAVLERPCRFREAALAALEAAGRPYRIVLETPSLAVLRACLDSDLAITCRTSVFSGRAIGTDAGPDLPALPQVAYVRHTRPAPHPTIGRLADLIGEAVLSL